MPDTPQNNGVFASLLKNGWIYPLEKTPLLVFRPRMTWLITALRRLLIIEVALDQEFEEYIFPRMVPEEVLAKTGWLTNHREEAWLIDPKREFIFEPDSPAETAGLFTKGSSFPEFPTTPLPYALDPIQCVSLYYALFNRTLKHSEWPIKAFEYQGGWSHRYEKSASGLLRGVEFLRLELVWIADQDQTIRLRTEVLKRAGQALQEQLQLKIHLAEGDSCFEEPELSTYEVLHELKDLVKLAQQANSIDIIAEYPDTQVEVASSGRHDSLPRRFQIQLQDETGKALDAWSGCLGLGLTRLAAVFLNTHGFDIEHWPERIRRYFQEASEKQA